MSDVSMTDTNEMREAVARCFIGPRYPVPATSRWTLEELQAVRWNHATPSERADALSAADTILALLATDRAAGVGEVERLRAERDYLLKRAGRAGSASWGTQRWTGMSSNALVDVAFGVENGCLPSDQNDLSACYLTVLRMPDHLISEEVLAQLEAGERAVGEFDWARENAQWPGADAIRARIAQEPRP